MGILANWKKVVTVDKIFEVLKSVHEGARAHTGYHKLYKDVEQTYYGIPRETCMEFIKGCVQCACKKPQRNVAPLTPITSKYFMHRGQLDLVDKRSDPDGQYCWIGHYIDHYTKFNFFWPQMNKSADEVAHNLPVHVFSVVGLPSILQHDNGREFCNAVIRETLKLWPGDGDVKIITGRPRHPRQRGLVEQVHDSLHKLLASKRADKPGTGWLEFLYEIQYSLNTQCHSSIKMTPFEAVFGQKANDGICVGSQETDEFIDKENIEYMIEAEGDVITDGQTENETDSQTENETDSQTENKTDSQTEKRPTHRLKLRPTHTLKLRPTHRQMLRPTHIRMLRPTYKQKLFNLPENDDELKRQKYLQRNTIVQTTDQHRTNSWQLMIL
ncbi:SCAN domain-containing protein 3-like [Mytilus edulis]|uniref:SCAN domain-containing protein 3-like n=1 Tax=Mytilus edulis TaxID=6550 RepID=UPI0039EEF937